jgi:hypothetical protein
MDKVEWPEDQLDYSDNCTIKITKVNFNGKFTHWEADLSFPDDGFYCGVTAPTMAGAIDEVMNYLYDVNIDWTTDDANRIRTAFN